MSDATLQVLIHETPAIISAIGIMIGAIGGVIAAWASLRNGRRGKVVEKKVDAVAKQTNGTNEALRRDGESLRRDHADAMARIGKLEGLLEGALTARGAARRATDGPYPPPAPVPAVVPQ